LDRGENDRIHDARRKEVVASKTRRVWAKAVHAVIAKHNEDARGTRCISSDASAYSFRHARISELLQIYGIDPITVAAQTGTSVAMIEKAYLRIIPSAMQEKLAALKG
jgi:integrase